MEPKEHWITPYIRRAVQRTVLHIVWRFILLRVLPTRVGHYFILYMQRR